MDTRACFGQCSERRSKPGSGPRRSRSARSENSSQRRRRRPAKSERRWWLRARVVKMWHCTHVAQDGAVSQSMFFFFRGLRRSCGGPGGQILQIWWNYCSASEKSYTPWALVTHVWDLLTTNQFYFSEPNCLPLTKLIIFWCFFSTENCTGEELAKCSPTKGKHRACAQWHHRRRCPAAGGH